MGLHRLPISARGMSLAIAGAVVLLLASACGSGGSKPAASLSPSATARSSPTVTVSPGQGVTDSEIQLGMTNDLSGAGGTPYAQVTQAMQTYFRKLTTEDGGVCGRKLTLIAQDDQYSPDHALEKTKELVETDHVLAMVGGLGTQVHAPVAAYLNDPHGDGNTADGI